MSIEEMLSSIFGGAKKISIQSIKDNKELTPKRICFASSHSNSLKRVSFEGNNVIGAFFLPFDDSINAFLEKETDLRIIKTKKGKFWCPANSEEDFNKLELFFKKYNDVVFLKDGLDCSIALSEHMIDENNRSILGELEFKAKYHDCLESQNALSEKINDFLENTNVFGDASYICAVPPSKIGDQNFPCRIVESVCSKNKNLVNISDSIQWKKNKSALKEVTYEEKLEILQNTDLNIGIDIKKKNIILVDDLYQSGVTMQFVAMKLKEAGAKKIYGLSIVKSRRDTDNK